MSESIIEELRRKLQEADAREEKIKEEKAKLEEEKAKLEEKLRDAVSSSSSSGDAVSSSSSSGDAVSSSSSSGDAVSSSSSSGDAVPSSSSSGDAVSSSSSSGDAVSSSSSSHDAVPSSNRDDVSSSSSFVGSSSSSDIESTDEEEFARTTKKKKVTKKISKKVIEKKFHVLLTDTDVYLKHIMDTTEAITPESKCKFETRLEEVRTLYREKNISDYLQLKNIIDDITIDLLLWKTSNDEDWEMSFKNYSLEELLSILLLHGDPQGMKSFASFFHSIVRRLCNRSMIILCRSHTGDRDGMITKILDGFIKQVKEFLISMKFPLDITKFCESLEYVDIKKAQKKNKISDYLFSSNNKRTLIGLSNGTDINTILTFVNLKWESIKDKLDPTERAKLINENMVDIFCDEADCTARYSNAKCGVDFRKLLKLPIVKVTDVTATFLDSLIAGGPTGSGLRPREIQEIHRRKNYRGYDHFDIKVCNFKLFTTRDIKRGIKQLSDKNMVGWLEGGLKSTIFPAETNGFGYNHPMILTDFRYPNIDLPEKMMDELIEHETFGRQYTIICNTSRGARFYSPCLKEDRITLKEGVEAIRQSNNSYLVNCKSPLDVIFNWMFHNGGAEKFPYIFVTGTKVKNGRSVTIGGKRYVIKKQIIPSHEKFADFLQAIRASHSKGGYIQGELWGSEKQHMEYQQVHELMTDLREFMRKPENADLNMQEIVNGEFYKNRIDRVYKKKPFTGTMNKSRKLKKSTDPIDDIAKSLGKSYDDKELKPIPQVTVFDGFNTRKRPIEEHHEREEDSGKEERSKRRRIDYDDPIDHDDQIKKTVIDMFTGDGVVGKILNILFEEKQISVKDLDERNSKEKFTENLISALNNGGYEKSQHSIKIGGRPVVSLWRIRRGMVTLNDLVEKIIDDYMRNKRDDDLPEDEHPELSFTT
jgi:hypothetical protein